MFSFTIKSVCVIFFGLHESIHNVVRYWSLPSLYFFSVALLFGLLDFFDLENHPRPVACEFILCKFSVLVPFCKKNFFHSFTESFIRVSVTYFDHFKDIINVLRKPCTIGSLFPTSLSISCDLRKLAVKLALGGSELDRAGARAKAYRGQCGGAE